MQLPPDRPISLATSFALLRVAAWVVPDHERGQFEYDWQQRLFHRWQFLRQSNLWNISEEFGLLASAMGTVPDAIQHFGAQQSVRTRVSRFIQSPFTSLGILLAILLTVAIGSGGFPASRNLFLKRLDNGHQRLTYVWAHNLRGGGDRPVPADVVEAWKIHSHLISSVAAFRAVPLTVQATGLPPKGRLVVITEPSFFEVMGLPQPASGERSYVLLSYPLGLELSRAPARVKGTTIVIDGNTYPLAGVLPEGFEPLSRQPSVYLVEPHYSEPTAFAAVKTNSGVTEKQLNKEFSLIDQNYTFYFLDGQLRFSFARSANWDPIRSFGFGLLASFVMLLMVFRLKWRVLWPQEHNKQAYARQAAFFAAKLLLSLGCVFTACLEWSRSSSAILFGNFDPASGPFLLWLYILGSTAALFWAVADQKARCRQCLQLLAFPVRMGSPGNLFLEWSGTEVCCTQGHGVLHVPHLAPSWADEPDHWIALDDSWQSIFGPDNRK